MKLEEINSVLLQIGDTEDAFLLYLCAHPPGLIFALLQYAKFDS